MTISELATAQSTDSVVSPTTAENYVYPRPPVIVYPDNLVVRTTEVPWKLVCKEFVVLDPSYSEYLGDYTNIVQRSASGSALNASNSNMDLETRIEKLSA